MINIDNFLEEIKASPYEEIIIKAPHTGVVSFNSTLHIGQEAKANFGQWKEIKGTKLATINREKNVKEIISENDGIIQDIALNLNNQFVEAGTTLMTLHHYLTRDEVVKLILRKTLYIFEAPEKGKYYFNPEIDLKVKVSGSNSVNVYNNMDLFILSRMKREVPLSYTGPDGIIYAVYFNHNENIDAGSALIGVCPKDLLPTIEALIKKVHLEWEIKV